ncbi:MAG TPA: ATP-binding protein [Bacteroides sp.]|nr:ATP-binding protein [Bacteroides sp.]
MERYAMRELEKWKSNPDRKPLIIRGSRQVGKTWLMKEFAARQYQHTAYINFESSKPLRNLFAEDYDVQRIIAAVRIETGVPVEPGKTLIIFDEIQEAEGAVTSLKYFHENAPHYHIISAGSLLGMATQRNVSFPVGMVEFLDLFPLNFEEFLRGLGHQSLADLILSEEWDLIRNFRIKLIQHLRSYYYVGGMPEAVLTHGKKNDLREVRDVQKNILIAYENDFSKHAPPEVAPRIRMLWNSIPAQLAKENKKFIYNALKPGARSKDYEIALSWLVDSGLVHQVFRVSKPGIPLKAYQDISAFKLFITDAGLLCAMGDVDPRTLLEGNVIFGEFKGALTEQYVLQQLKTIPGLPVYYWSAERSTSEIDFLIQHNGRVIPVEVKAEENLKAKSLKVYSQKFSPATAIRTSMSDFRRGEWMINLPLYAIGKITDMIDD